MATTEIQHLGSLKDFVLLSLMSAVILLLTLVDMQLRTKAYFRPQNSCWLRWKKDELFEETFIVMLGHFFEVINQSVIGINGVR